MCRPPPTGPQESAARSFGGTPQRPRGWLWKDAMPGAGHSQRNMGLRAVRVQPPNCYAGWRALVQIQPVPQIANGTPLTVEAGWLWNRRYTGGLEGLIMRRRRVKGPALVGVIAGMPQHFPPTQGDIPLEIWAGIPYQEAAETVNLLGKPSVGSTPTRPTKCKHTLMVSARSRKPRDSERMWGFESSCWRHMER